MHGTDFTAKPGLNISMLGYLAADNHLRYFEGFITPFDACRYSYLQYQRFNFGQTSQVLQENWQFCIRLSDGHPNVNGAYAGGKILF